MSPRISLRSSGLHAVAASNHVVPDFASLIRATCCCGVEPCPGYRFAHPGYMLSRRRTMSSRISLRSSGLHAVAASSHVAPDFASLIRATRCCGVEPCRPGFRFAHPGYTLLRRRTMSPRISLRLSGLHAVAASNHVVPDIASLIRATRCCGVEPCRPGFRFAHPGYMLLRRRTMSPRISLRSSGLHAVAASNHVAPDFASLIRATSAVMAVARMSEAISGVNVTPSANPPYEETYFPAALRSAALMRSCQPGPPS